MAAVLLVDGDRNFRSALAIALRLDGVEVAAADSADALRLTPTDAFDLVVVDSLLPDADTLLARAAELGLRAVATGPHPELLARAARRHRVPTLEKPFSAGALLAICGEAAAPRS
jgi:DNA-binding NtrC family response regulator